LVVAGEKMTGPPTAEVARALARSLATSEESIGATMPALAAVVAQRYLERYDPPSAAFDAVSVLARRQAALNEFAQFRTPVSRQEVAESRPVALPLRLLHCAAVSDGAAAVVLERGVGAASVLGVGQGFDTLMVADRTDLTSLRATRLAAQKAYEMAHATRKEIQFAELHDAFAPFALIDLEDIGACGAGEAGGWFDREETGPAGRFPVNLSGGLLGRGHPVGVSGLVQIVEVARQLRGEAGPAQLAPVPRMGLAQSIGGLGTHNFVSILGSPAGG
jgi:acetyl-CoA C-acetyltransferase